MNNSKWHFRANCQDVELIERDIYLRYVKNNCADLIFDSSEKNVDFLFGYPRSNMVYTRRYILYLENGVSNLVPRVVISFHYDKRVRAGKIEMSKTGFDMLYRTLCRNGHRAPQNGRVVSSCATASH